MKNLVNQIRSAGIKEVIIIGDIMLDEYYFGSVSRISPEAPVPVVKEDRREWCLGGASNVAANCKHIGCDVTLIGVIGHQDNEGLKLLSMLKEVNVRTDGIVRSADRVTTCKKRILAKNHQMLRLDSESQEPLSEREYAQIITHIDTYTKKSSIIIVSDYAKGVITEELMAYLCQKAREIGCIILVDPKGPNFAKYKGVDYLKPNIHEFNQLVQFFGIVSALPIEEKGRELCNLLALKGLIITMGEKGILYVTQDRVISSPAQKREVYDLTGAGDTVCAFLALGLVHGLSMEDCLRIANHAAAIAVSHLKTYAVSLEELIDCATEPTIKIYHDWAQLKIELDWLRVENKKVVLTNGCFDILHPGHIQTLKEAKKFGDILVVALNGDASIRRLKGSSRPINNLPHRATMMAAIGFVDFVVSFDQDTPKELIEYIRPDVLVKGGDYQRENVVGYDIITSYGGCVEIIDTVPGVSTTAIISAIATKEHIIG